MKNFKIKIGKTTKSFKKKPDKSEIPSIKFFVDNITLLEFKNNISNGYAFCALFTDNDIFSIKDKKIENFKETSVIPIDVDDSDVDMETFVSRLEIKPSIYYETFSNNNEEKKYRFRLLYISNKPITDKHRYCECYYHFTKDMDLKDDCMKSINQMYFGTRKEAKIGGRMNVFDLSAIPNMEPVEIINKEKKKSVDKQEVKLIDGIDKGFLNDYYRFDIGTFLDRYRDVYISHQFTPFDMNVDEDQAYILLPSDFLTIKRRTITLVDDITKNVIDVPVKVKDGEGRRKKLFINGLIRRFMLKDNVSIEHMITMLTHEVYHYFENDVDEITKDEIIGKAFDVMKADLNKYSELSKQEHPKFVVNMNYCIKHKCSKKQAVQIAKGQITEKKIEEFYDSSLTNKENLEKLKEKGIDVSLRTLQLFKKKHNIK